jgi:hypothetical protein
MVPWANIKWNKINHLAWPEKMDNVNGGSGYAVSTET